MCIYKYIYICIYIYILIGRREFCVPNLLWPQSHRLRRRAIPLWLPGRDVQGSHRKECMCSMCKRLECHGAQSSAGLNLLRHAAHFMSCSCLWLPPPDVLPPCPKHLKKERATPSAERRAWEWKAIPLREAVAQLPEEGVHGDHAH